MAELWKQALRGLQEPGKGLSLDQLQAVVEHRVLFEPAKKVVFRGVNALVEEWKKFYKEIFNLDVDFSNLQLPAQREGFNWLVILLSGMTIQRLFDKCRELFPAWKEEIIMSKEVIKSDRNPANGTYAVWFRNRREADEELRNRSANELKRENISGITLEERLVLELFYRWKTKKHLDTNNQTLCSGSYCDGVGIPCAYWHNSWFCIDWLGSNDVEVFLRSREASC